jgi:hypothetical protein
VTDNFSKRQQIISFVAIASTITACSIAPSISPQLGLNQPISKIHTPQDKFKILWKTAKLRPTGVKTTLFRSPGGFLNNGLAAYAKSQKNLVTLRFCLSTKAVQK